MALFGTNLDYTDKDFDALRARLFNVISGVFPTWTARQIANFGNILIDAFAFVGDVTGKYQDNQANESRWTKAFQRKNLIALAKLIDFEANTATASQVDVTLSIPASVAGDSTIIAGTICRTRSATAPIIFRLLSDAVIPAGSTSVTDQTAENSEPQEDVFTSPGTPNLEIVFGATPYIDGSAVISAGNGVFSEVDNFLDSTSSDRHFTVTVDQNDRATARFGDGINGQIPTGTITGSYKTGGGAAGVVEAGTVLTIEGSFTDEFGTGITVSVTNPAASTPATNRDTVEQIRQNAPLSIRVLNRTVAREDYEINALKLPTVARALMLTSNEDVAIGENAGFLFIIPVGGGAPTTALKAAVLEQVTVTFPNTVTFFLTVADPLFLTINVQATVWLAEGQTAATVLSRINAALVAHFQSENADGTLNENIDFGFNFLEATGDPEGKLPWSDIFNVIRDTTGVRKIDDGIDGLLLNGVRSDVDLLLREFPILGTVTILNGATGAPL